MKSLEMHEVGICGLCGLTLKVLRSKHPGLNPWEKSSQGRGFACTGRRVPALERVIILQHIAPYFLLIPSARMTFSTKSLIPTSKLALAGSVSVRITCPLWQRAWASVKS